MNPIISGLVRLLPGRNTIKVFSLLSLSSAGNTLNNLRVASTPGRLRRIFRSLLLLTLMFSYPAVLGQVTSLPYFEDFESGAGEWTALPTNGWELGTPSTSQLNSANSGSNAWATNLDGNYPDLALYFLTSPIFDFSSLSGDPSLIFSINYKTEPNWDVGYLEISINGGVNWNVLGSNGSGSNWYNDTSNDSGSEG